MSRTSSSKSGLFLMELIIAIAFFAFASALCVQLFAKAHTISQTSTNVNMAVTRAQSASECFKNTNASVEKMAELLGTTPAGDSIDISYDANWNIMPQQNAETRFVMTVYIDKSSPLAVADINVFEIAGEKSLHSVQTKKYIGNNL